MSTDTGNKLILESPFASDVHKKWLETILRLGEPEKLYSALKYHSSWDWLMPVATKIIKDARWLVDKEYAAHRSDIMFELGTCGIDRVYNAIVTFITWYNTNPQNS